jgi:hypothetical protein
MQHSAQRLGSWCASRLRWEESCLEKWAGPQGTQWQLQTSHPTVPCLLAQETCQYSAPSLTQTPPHSVDLPGRCREALPWGIPKLFAEGLPDRE